MRHRAICFLLLALTLPGLFASPAPVMAAAQPDSIQIKLSATISLKLLGLSRVTFTLPIDSTFIRIGQDAVFGRRDLDDATIEQITGIPGSAGPVQTLADSLANFGLNFPEESFKGRRVTLHVEFRNFVTTVGSPNQDIAVDPVVVNGDTIPIFFYARMSIEKDGRLLDRFDFKEGFPLTIRIPTGPLEEIFFRSGFENVVREDLVLAYLTPQGLDRNGIVTEYDPVKDELIVRASHLSDLIGIRRNDAPVPPIPAIITGPAAITDTTFAVIVWQTDRNATSQVRFGLAKNALTDSVSTPADSAGVLAHSVRLTSLTKSTKYYYQVWSVDAYGRRVESDVNSFRTSNKPDFAVPVFSARPVVRDVGPDNALIDWKTDRRSTSTVKFDTTKALTQETSDPSEVVHHRITLFGLTPGKRYFFVASSSIGARTVVSDTLTFDTPVSPDTSPLIIHKQARVDAFATTDTTALVEWTTNAASNSEVLFWKKGSPDTLAAFDAQLVREHLIILSGLSSATDYLFYVRSSHVATGRSVTGKIEKFRTRPAGQTVPLRFVERPKIAYRTNTFAVVAWKTNLPADGFVYYQQVPQGVDTFNADSAFVRGDITPSLIHSVTIGGLVSGSRYLVVITSKATNGQIIIHPPGAQVTLKPLTSDPVGATIITGIVQVPGSEGNFTTSSGPDTQAPVILNGPTVVSQTQNALVVQWETDELSSSVVNFGPGTSLDQTYIDEQQVTSHQVTLSNLAPKTSYSYQVASTDPSNNGPTNSGTSAASTVQSADTTPPVVSDASIKSYPSDVEAVIQWDTDEGANSEVLFGSHPDSVNVSLVAADIVEQHSVTLTGLTASVKYYYQTASTDPGGNRSSLSLTHSFTTASAPDTLHPVISGVSAVALAQKDSTATITFTWTTDRLSTGFVDYDTVNTLATKAAAGSQTGVIEHRIDVTGLKLGTTYHYQVGSSNVHDNRVPAPVVTSSVLSVVAPSTIDAAGPAAPAVTAIAGDGAVLVRWTHSTDASGIKGYEILRDGVAIATNVTDTTYLDQGAVNGTAYTYTITPVDKVGNAGATSSASNQVTPAVTQVPTAPAPVATADTVSVKPILVVGNAAPVTGDATRATLTYGFQVATDSVFASVIVSASGIVQGAGTNPTHWQVIDSGQPDSTALLTATRYWWRSRANDGVFSGPWSASKTFTASVSRPTGIASSPVEPPKSYVLRQNAPNPFNPQTTIRFELPKPEQATLVVYNLLGQEVARLLDRALLGAGVHTVVWNGRNAANQAVSSGLYFYRLTAGEFTTSRKMTLLK